MATTTELEPLSPESSSIRLPPLLNEVTSIDYGIKDDCEITFKCNTTFFIVLLSMQSPVGSIERNYLESLNRSLESGQEEESKQIFTELEDLLASLCQPWFREFATDRPASTPPVTSLYRTLYLEKLQLRLKTIKNAATLEVEEAPRTSKPNSFRNETFKLLPTYKPSEVEILATLKNYTVFKALIRESTVCVKVIGYQSSTESIRREIGLLQQISEAQLDPRLRTPTLLGLISCEENSDLVLGLVMDYVEPGALESDLSNLALEPIPQIQRDTWARQISDDLNRLHDLGLVWGDAKAANIIFDKNCDPWIIDFGGGYTDGWVDEGLVDSISGDLQGLGKIIDIMQSPSSVI